LSRYNYIFMELFGYQISKKSATVQQLPQINPTFQSMNTEITDALNSIFKTPQTAIYFMYHYLPEFTAPINFKLDKIAALPIRHVRHKADGTDEIIKNSPILKLLKKPNQFQTQTEYVKYFLLNAMLNGEVFQNQIKLAVWGITQSYILPAEKIRVNWMDEMEQDYRLKEIKDYYYNGMSRIEADAMVWRKEVCNYNTPDARGMSKLNSLLNSGKALQAIYESAIKTLADRGALGLITPSVNDNGIMLEPTEQKALKEAWAKKYGITGDKSPVVIANMPLTYTPVAMNLQELQLNETQLRNFRNCCMVLGVPPPLLGDLSGAALNNMKILERSLYENSIKPATIWMLETFDQAFQLPEDESLIADYSDVDVLQADAKIKADTVSILVDKRIISEAAARRETGYTEEDAPEPIKPVE